MYLSLHQDSGIQNLIKSSDNETYTSHHDCKFIGIPAITQSDPVPKKNGNKYVLYEKRTDNGAVCHLFQAQQANGCLEKPMVKGTLFRCGVWHMEEIKGNPKSQEAYKTSKQV